MTTRSIAIKNRCIIQVYSESENWTWLQLSVEHRFMGKPVFVDVKRVKQIFVCIFLKIYVHFIHAKVTALQSKQNK